MPLCWMAYCTVPYFGFKAKQAVLDKAVQEDCTVPYFGFKAKLSTREAHIVWIVLCLILDSRQNRASMSYEDCTIVLCLILDSRQNKIRAMKYDRIIVLCLILDSRQNIVVLGCLKNLLYCALFWIQGKTRQQCLSPAP